MLEGSLLCEVCSAVVTRTRQRVLLINRRVQKGKTYHVFCSRQCNTTFYNRLKSAQRYGNKVGNTMG